MEKKINNFDEYGIINLLPLDLSGIDREVKISRSDFLRMVEPGIGGVVDFNLFGEWLKIEGDGLYVNTDHEGVVELTPEEASVLSLHPTGNIKEPVLRFPFTVNELIELLKFTNQEGIDFPISHDVFYGVISEKQINNNTDGEVKVKKECSSSLTSESESHRNKTGLGKINQQKKELREEIKQMARDIWYRDDDSEYIIIVVARMIRDHFIHKGRGDVMEIDSIKKIIRPIAPAYAKKPGRPKKYG
ncbi:hypothetical protein [Raoultella ornithinolytica]|uniref:hypothetical protein n=1 Tax=Raoultella ornithinolytica TaxID=54291 RepID=UPI003D3683F1